MSKPPKITWEESDRCKLALQFIVEKDLYKEFDKYCEGK